MMSETVVCAHLTDDNVQYHWLPEDSRPALDAAIATARRKGVPPAQWDDVEVRKLITTGIDGSSAIGVLAHCRNKRKNVLGSLVLKRRGARRVGTARRDAEGD